MGGYGENFRDAMAMIGGLPASERSAMSNRGGSVGQREIVQASLLASHGVDEVARRKVADDVRQVVTNGACVAVQDAIYGAVKAADMAIDATITAASAVVLASDLRAPGLADEDAYYPTRAGEIDMIAELTAANESAKAWVWVAGREQVEDLARILMTGSGWLERGGERGCEQARGCFEDALSIVRSLLGGE